MKVNDQYYRTVWIDADDAVSMIDQRFLPHEFKVVELRTVDEVAYAIKRMQVRGAGAIGATAGFGMVIAALTAPRSSREAFFAALRESGEQLKATRPTAVNLEWAVHRQLAAVNGLTDFDEIVARIRETAQAIADEDAESCRMIGEHGLQILEEIHARKKDGEPVNVLTHCNAGWLAFVDYGSATAPIYAAHEKGIPVHVWVDETRPRNQGARLTAWELGQHGVPHTVIADNVGGYIMQHGLVDVVITGSDRTTRTGDVGNKIGTYLKALAAHDNGVPFYAALPSSTFDWNMRDGVKEVPIEQRNADEVTHIQGLYNGEVVTVQLTPGDSPAANYAFDVTPARLVTGIITERGICQASEESILGLFPEHQ